MNSAVQSTGKASCQGHSTIEEAFERFQAAIYPSDARLFNSIQLKDVWEAAKAVEMDQSTRKSLRNTRRLEPLLKALNIFGNVIEPLCQGVPYLCYIWVCY